MRCQRQGAAHVVLPVDPALPQSGYLQALLALSPKVSPGGRLVITLAAATAVETTIKSHHASFRQGGLPRRGALRWSLQGAQDRAILLLRVGPGSKAGPGCQLLTNMQAVWLAPGSRAGLRFHVSIRDVQGLNLVAHTHGETRLEARVDDGHPWRRHGLIFAPFTAATTTLIAPARGEHAWVVHRPIRSVRETAAMFLPLHADLKPGVHELIVVNHGDDAVWVRGFERGHAALD